MTCHISNLDVNIKKMRGVKIRPVIVDEMNIPFTIVIKNDEIGRAISVLEKLVRDLRKRATIH